jgi:mono/diheme cytochrome c family protein
MSMFRSFGFVIALLMFANAGFGAQEHAGEVLEKGSYLVQLLGCGRCHTEGYLAGTEAAGPHLAGSRIGIGYTGGDRPGIVFPGNLTSDPETGIGGWTRQEIVSAMTRGTAADSHRRLSVMPWMDYSGLSASDLEAIAEYLMNLPPVSRRIPDAIPPGMQPTEEYVRFGIYHFTPLHSQEEHE